VLLAGEIESRIRIELEWLAFQTKISFIHRLELHNEARNDGRFGIR
jgi:hypothetical protein